MLAAAALPSPSTAGMTNYGSFSLGGNSSATIQPGIYSSISVSGNARLTMAGGIYIIEGGGFSVADNASVTGSGVMIVNGGSNYPGTGGTYGGITQGGNATINLSPLTSGPYAGIVLFQPPDNTKTITVSGNASGITGTIYAPGAALSESGNAGAPCVPDRRYAHDQRQRHRQRPEPGGSRRHRRRPGVHLRRGNHAFQPDRDRGRCSTRPRRTRSRSSSRSR